MQRGGERREDQVGEHERVGAGVQVAEQDRGVLAPAGVGRLAEPLSSGEDSSAASSSSRCSATSSCKAIRNAMRRSSLRAPGPSGAGPPITHPGAPAPAHRATRAAARAWSRSRGRSVRRRHPPASSHITTRNAPPPHPASQPCSAASRQRPGSAPRGRRRGCGRARRGGGRRARGLRRRALSSARRSRSPAGGRSGSARRSGTPGSLPRQPERVPLRWRSTPSGTRPASPEGPHMPRLLFVHASPRGPESASLAIAEQLLDARGHVYTVDRLDLFATPPALFTGHAVAAKMQVDRRCCRSQPSTRTPGPARSTLTDAHPRGRHAAVHRPHVERRRSPGC